MTGEGARRPSRPPIPSSCASLRDFGVKVMRWGTGSAAARARVAMLTREELERAGVTRAMAEAWRDFYCNELALNPENRAPQVGRS